jgi:hypothetical protein
LLSGGKAKAGFSPPVVPMLRNYYQNNRFPKAPERGYFCAKFLYVIIVLPQDFHPQGQGILFIV